jgi:hypothetical protein
LTELVDEPLIEYLDQPATYYREGLDVMCRLQGGQLFRFPIGIARQILANLGQALDAGWPDAPPEDPELYPLLQKKAMDALIQLLESTKADIEPDQIAAILRMIDRPL